MLARPHGPRPAVQRGHLRPGRAALPRGHDRQRRPAGAHRGRAHARRRSTRPTSAVQAFNLALAASPESPGAGATWPGPASSRRSATTCGPGSGPTARPTPSSCLDGNWVGGSAGSRARRHGPRAQPGGHRRRRLHSPTSRSSSRGTRSSFTETPGPAGSRRSRRAPGRGRQPAQPAPTRVDQINGTMFGMRRWLPLQGIAGGSPGACTEFLRTPRRRHGRRGGHARFGGGDRAG